MLGFISNVRIMRYLLFNAFHGAAGDMITGSLLALGADPEPVRKAMRSVVKDPSIRSVMRKGIRAIKVDTHASSQRRSLDEVIGIVRGADAPPGCNRTGIEGVSGGLPTAEESVHGEQPHFHEVGADDAIADVIGACTALHCLNPDIISVTEFAPRRRDCSDRARDPAGPCTGNDGDTRLLRYTGPVRQA